MFPQGKKLALVLRQTTKNINTDQVNWVFPDLLFLPSLLTTLQIWAWGGEKLTEKLSFFSFCSPSRFPDPGRPKLREYSLLPYFKIQVQVFMRGAK